MVNSWLIDGVIYNWGMWGNFCFFCFLVIVNGYLGEGFFGVDGEGNWYFFDVGIECWVGLMDFGGLSFGMVWVLLMVSWVEDLEVF